MRTKGVENEHRKIDTEANAYDDCGHPNESPEELFAAKHYLSSFVLALKASIKENGYAE